jgi:hypothetical protein
MDYRRIYDGLINRAVERKWNRSTATCYVEFHHVIPKCIGGDDSIGNVVCLTAREHFIAHLLLMKIYPTESKLAFAAHMLTRGSNKHDRVNNREYKWLKERRSEHVRSLFKGVPKTETHKQNMKGKRPHVNQTGLNNNAFKGLIQTPFGVFESLKQAASVEGVDTSTIHYRIHNTSEKFTEYKRIPV